MTRILEDVFEDALCKDQLHDLDGLILSAALDRGRLEFEKREAALGDCELPHEGWLLGCVG